MMHLIRLSLTFCKVSY